MTEPSAGVSRYDAMRAGRGGNSCRLAMRIPSTTARAGIANMILGAFLYISSEVFGAHA